jgi:hypothetical protein
VTNSTHLSESEEPLLVPDARPLDHDVVLLHLPVVRKPAHGIDGLVGQVVSVKEKHQDGVQSFPTISIEAVDQVRLCFLVSSASLKRCSKLQDNNSSRNSQCSGPRNFLIGLRTR